MTTKTQKSGIAVRTLGGVFEQPKMDHRRDFLLENKLSLRELQKNTSQKLRQQKHEYESRQYKHLQKFYKNQEQILSNGSSENRNVEINSKRKSRITTKDVSGKAQYLPCRRAYSQQRCKGETVQTVCNCCCAQQQHKPQFNGNQSSEEHMSRIASSSCASSKANKEIQTEDIHDEIFLYEALKKCSSSEVSLLHKEESNNELNTESKNLHHTYPSCRSQQYEPELKNKRSHEVAAYISENHDDVNNVQKDKSIHHSIRSHNYISFDNEEDENVHQKFQNLKITSNGSRRTGSQLSARSRQTGVSNSSKKTVYKIGSREDLRLPKYLEKEKREKEEEEHLCESTKDLNCPLGYYALGEEERLKALHKAEQRMLSLINELNHMPMTIETLRIRNRKVEIERELAQIEFDIRLYSKPKVYIQY